MYARSMCMVNVSESVMAKYKWLSLKYCILGSLISLFNLTIAYLTLPVGGKLKIIIHLVETSSLAPQHACCSDALELLTNPAL